METRTIKETIRGKGNDIKEKPSTKGCEIQSRNDLRMSKTPLREQGDEKKEDKEKEAQNEGDKLGEKKEKRERRK